MVQLSDSRVVPFGSRQASSALSGSECAFGVFDGFHRGHRFIVGQAADSAQQKGVSSAIITFDVDPEELFRPESCRKLMTNERRLQALCDAGVSAVVVIPFTREFASLSPEAFLDRMFEVGTPAGLHVGIDFRFGCRASGSVETARQWGIGHGMNVEAYELLGCDGGPITSTRIRDLLAACKIEDANELLGTFHGVTSCVESGRGEGEALGFKTANLSIPKEYCVLGEGVYGAYVHLDGQCYKAAVSLGIPPTFKDTARHNCEAHILDYEGNLYGQDITLEFVRFLRPMRVFSSTEELIATVMANIEWVRSNL